MGWADGRVERSEAKSKRSSRNRRRRRKVRQHSCKEATAWNDKAQRRRESEASKRKALPAHVSLKRESRSRRSGP